MHVAQDGPLAVHTFLAKSSTLKLNFSLFRVFRDEPLSKGSQLRICVCPLFSSYSEDSFNDSDHVPIEEGFGLSASSQQNLRVDDSMEIESEGIKGFSVTFSFSLNP
jgi:hypothetical protein